jgi:hypothetical protein
MADAANRCLNCGARVDGVVGEVIRTVDQPFNADERPLPLMGILIFATLLLAGALIYLFE